MTAILSPEQQDRASRELWGSVILRAIADAHGRAYVSGAESRAEVIAEACAWFEEAGEDFLEVCDMAGVDPQVIRDVALGPLPATFSHQLTLIDVEMSQAFKRSCRAAEHIPVIDGRTRQRNRRYHQERKKRAA